jgi:hypothetical protein
MHTQEISLKDCTKQEFPELMISNGKFNLKVNLTLEKTILYSKLLMLA